MPSYNDVGQLATDELKHLDNDTRQLVADYHAAGWRSYLSNRGHVYLLAPDGVTTEAVSRNTGGRRRKNQRQDLNRWLAGRPHAAPMIPHDTDNTTPGETVNTTAVADALTDAVEPDRPKRKHRARATSTPTTAFACTEPGCGKTFTQASGLRMHTARMHRPLICPECGRQDFGGSPAAYAQHRETEHGVTPYHRQVKEREARAAAAGGVYVCEWGCGKTFTNATSLGGHRKVHKGQPLPTRPTLELVREARASTALDGETVDLGPQPSNGTSMAPVLVEPTPEPSTGSASDDVRTLLHEHALNLAEGEDAEQLVASIRALVAAPLMNKLTQLAAENDELRAANKTLVEASKEADARLALLREALSV